MWRHFTRAQTSSNCRQQMLLLKMVSEWECVGLQWSHLLAWSYLWLLTHSETCSPVTTVRLATLRTALKLHPLQRTWLVTTKHVGLRLPHHVQTTATFFHSSIHSSTHPSTHPFIHQSICVSTQCLPSPQDNCYYHGRIVNDSESLVSMSTCDGLR